MKCFSVSPRHSDLQQWARTVAYIMEESARIFGPRFLRSNHEARTLNPGRARVCEQLSHHFEK